MQCILSNEQQMGKKASFTKCTFYENRIQITSVTLEDHFLPASVMAAEPPASGPDIERVSTGTR
jgi:hypothetical protein